MNGEITTGQEEVPFFNQMKMEEDQRLEDVFAKCEEGVEVVRSCTESFLSVNYEPKPSDTEDKVTGDKV